MQSSYPDVLLLIDGKWIRTTETLPVENPATGEELGRVFAAGRPELDAALAAASEGFAKWKDVSAFERAKVLRNAGAILRTRVEEIAQLMTLEQGKPLAESRMETSAAADIIEWFADEGRRAYGRVVPARVPKVTQLVVKQPVGPVAAFTPWNFPINQSVRPVAAALAAGCSVILKGPEETPASCAALIRAFVDGGVPAGAINLVFGKPAAISEYLVPHPIIRKIAFTGSTSVGKLLAAQAGAHMKRASMELGGHAPAIVFDDADFDATVNLLAIHKFRNAGQTCISPTRILVQRNVFDDFVAAFVERARAVKIGDGLDPETQMGPLANARRVAAMDQLVADARSKGAKLHAGGQRIGNRGNYYAPTVLTDVTTSMDVMNVEPFGPIAPIISFDDIGEAIAEANRLPYGLAAYAYSRSASRIAAVSSAIDCGLLSINHHGLSLAELPHGGVKDSGYGSDGGPEALEGYFYSKLITQMAV